MKPILFNTEGVKAILDGRKSVTRRVVKPQPLDKIGYIFAGYKSGTWGYPSDGAWKYWGEEWRREQPLPDAEKSRRWTPPYRTGDTLYVRETFAKMPYGYVYRADGDEPEGWDCDDRWRPSIHMPKEAARLFLRVTGVQVERLQEIDYDGCKAEGIWDDYKVSSEEYHEALMKLAYPETFSELWDNAIKKADLPRYGWEANPWVWVIQFERISKEEAFANA